MIEQVRWHGSSHICFDIYIVALNVWFRFHGRGEPLSMEEQRKESDNFFEQQNNIKERETRF